MYTIQAKPKIGVQPFGMPENDFDKIELRVFYKGRAKPVKFFGSLEQTGENWVLTEKKYPYARTCVDVWKIFTDSEKVESAILRSNKK